MKKNHRLEKSDKLIVVASTLCALLLFSWLVYDIAFLNPNLEGQVEIGKIYEAQNKVKRKFNRSLIWYAAGKNEAVYENDWIFTGSQSIAKIRLDSGGELIIEPDSLIILSRKNGILQLDLQHGQLMADIKSKNVEINIVKKSGARQKIDTSSGAVAIKRATNPINGEKGDFVVEALDLGNTQGLGEKEATDLNGLAGSSSSLADPLSQKPASLGDLADQKYFKAEPGFTPLTSEGFSFREQYNYDFKLFPGQSTKVALDWIDPYNKWQGYDTEVALDSDFQKVIAKGRTSSPVFPVTVKETAAYHWRVRGVDEKSETGQWSAIQLANVNIETRLKEKPLQLSKRNLRYRMDHSELKSVLPDESFNVSKEKPVTISWEEDPRAALYKVQVSEQADFSSIREEKLVKETSTDLNNIKLGKTFFRVIPETKEGYELAEEATGNITTLFPSPIDKSLKTIDKEDYQSLQWESVPYAKGYKVTYKTDKNSQKEQVKYVTGNNMKVKSDSGFLQWKVQVADPKTKTSLSANSATVDWYEAAKKLASVNGDGVSSGPELPKILKPEPRKTFISMNNSPLFIVMNWQYSLPATAYHVEISKRPDMKGLVFKKTVKQQRLVIRQVFQPGVYYMRVRAAAENVIDEAWSEVEAFRVLNQGSN